jgi:hypothetical protein
VITLSSSGRHARFGVEIRFTGERRPAEATMAQLDHCTHALNGARDEDPLFAAADQDVGAPSSDLA